jgi:hypothetical protein
MYRMMAIVALLSSVENNHWNDGKIIEYRSAANLCLFLNMKG